MDKDRRVSIETISAQFDDSVGTVYTIIHEELKMQKIWAKFVPRVLILVKDYLTKSFTIRCNLLLNPRHSFYLAHI